MPARKKKRNAPLLSKTHLIEEIHLKVVLKNKHNTGRSNRLYHDYLLLGIDIMKCKITHEQIYTGNRGNEETYINSS